MPWDSCPMKMCSSKPQSFLNMKVVILNPQPVSPHCTRGSPVAPAGVQRNVSSSTERVRALPPTEPRPKICRAPLGNLGTVKSASLPLDWQDPSRLSLSSRTLNTDYPLVLLPLKSDTLLLRPPPQWQSIPKCTSPSSGHATRAKTFPDTAVRRCGLMLTSSVILQHEPGHHPGHVPGVEENPVRRPNRAQRVPRIIRDQQPHHRRDLLLHLDAGRKEEGCVAFAPDSAAVFHPPCLVLGYFLLFWKDSAD
jgi:hypothetical protein